MTVAGRLALICWLVMASGCRPEATLELILIDVDECGDDELFRGTQSVGVTLFGKAAFDEQRQLSGCRQQFRCFARQDFDTSAGFETLRLAMQQDPPLFSTSPGTEKGIVVTGYGSAGCKPPDGGPPDLRFCGYQLGAFPETDSRMYMLISCLPGVCESSEFIKDVCPNK